MSSAAAKPEHDAATPKKPGSKSVPRKTASEGGKSRTEKPPNVIPGSRAHEAEGPTLSEDDAIGARGWTDSPGDAVDLPEPALASKPFIAELQDELATIREKIGTICKGRRSSQKDDQILNSPKFIPECYNPLTLVRI